MAKFEVTMTCIYNGVAKVEANNAEEAMEKVRESLNWEALKDFPDEVNTPYGSFSFGEATADYADPLNDED